MSDLIEAELPEGCDARLRIEADVVAALSLRFPAPAYCFLSHVRNATGFSRVTRTADAIAMSLWPSRGLELHGFEVKVSRGDWLRELKDPRKADEIASRCDRWWIAAGHKDIVRPGELPPTWGLMVPNGKSMKVSVEAPLNPDSKAITREFMAAIMRRVAETQPGEEEIARRVRVIEEELRQKDGEARAAERASWNERIKRDVEFERNKIVAFEKESGIRIEAWNGGQLGAAVKLILEGRVEERRVELERLVKQMETITTYARSVLGGKTDA